MKISKIIEKLETIRENAGDIDVKISGSDPEHHIYWDYFDDFEITVAFDDEAKNRKVQVIVGTLA